MFTKLRTQIVTAVVADFPQPRKPDWAKFEKSMQNRVKANRAALFFKSADPANVWSVADVQQLLWNEAAAEVETNIAIFDKLSDLEWSRGNRAGAAAHHQQALAWFEWGKVLASATPAQYFEYYWQKELGL